MAVASFEELRNTNIPSFEEIRGKAEPEVETEPVLFGREVILPRQQISDRFADIFKMNKEIEDYLPFEDRFQLGKIVGLADNPQDERDRLANELYFSVQLQAEPKSIHNVYDELVQKRFGTKWPPRKVRQQIKTEAEGDEFVNWAADPSAPPLITPTDLPKGVGKPGYIRRLREAAERYRPDETILERATRMLLISQEPAIDAIHGLGARLQYLNLKTKKGLIFGADDVLIAAINRINPEFVKGRTIEEATLAAADYDPSRFMKLTGGLLEFLGRLRTGRAIGTQLGLLAPPEYIRNLGVFEKALEAGKLGFISGGGKEITAIMSESLNPGKDYGSEGAVGPIKDAAILATFSLANSLVLSPALQKFAATRMGQRIIKAADRETAKISLRFPRTMDKLRRTPTEEQLKKLEGGLYKEVPDIETGIIREMKVDPATLNWKDRALLRHAARAIDTYHKRLYQAYMRHPTPDVVFRRPAAPEALAAPPTAPPALLPAKPPIVPPVAPPAKPEPTAVKDMRFMDETVGVAHGQRDGRIAAYNKEGDYLGHINYAEFENEISIKWIEVIPEQRRKGIGTALYNQLKKEYPDMVITPFGDVASKEGAKFIEAVAPAPPVTEPAVKEAEVEIRDLSDKTRKKLIKQTEQEILKSEVYQVGADALEEMGADIGEGYYYVPKNLKSEVLDITGKPGQKGFKKRLYKSFTFDPTEKATDWTKAVQEAAFRRGVEGIDAYHAEMDISDFVRRVDMSITAKEKVGKLNQEALERAIASGDLGVELSAMKLEMLKDGLSAEEINDTIKQWAKDYELTEEDIETELVPEEKVYVEEKPSVFEEVARKGRKAKAKLTAEEAAIVKAKNLTTKKKETRFVWEKDNKFHVTKSPPTNIPYIKIEPPKGKQLKTKVTRVGPTPEEVATKEQKARAHIVAKQKNLLSEKGKPTKTYRRIAKIYTGKTTTTMMTQEEVEHFIAMMEMLPKGKAGKPPKIPTSKDIITKELADKIDKFQNIGFLERFRPAWRVFEKIGLFKEVFEPAFVAEVGTIEELTAFRKEATAMKKSVGEDPEVSTKLFRAIENPGSVKLTKDERTVVEWGKKYYDDWADRLNLPEDKRRKNYITHIFEAEIAQSLKSKYPLDPDLVRALEFITPKTIFNPFLQERIGRTVGLKEDFWAAIEAYENKALKKFYYEPLIQRIRVYEKFLPPNSARYLRGYITRITNRPLVIDREINETLKEAAEAIAKLPGGEELSQYLTKGNAAGILAYNMTGIYYECWLGLRPASAIKNLSQHGLILAETGPTAFAEALRTTGAERARLLSNSIVLRSRKTGYLPGVDETFIRQLESKRRAITMAMFKAADRVNVSDAFLAGYYEAKAKGLPDKYAYKRGDEVARKTQYIYSKLGASQFSQTAPGRVLGVLTTWPENWAELMNEWIQAKPSTVYSDYEKDTGKKVTPTDWVGRRKSLWIYLSMVSLAMLIHKTTDFKALYYTGWTSIKALADIAHGKLAGLEIPGIIADLTAGVLLGDKKRIKSAWTRIKKFPVILKELVDVLSGDKDWMRLFIYLEKSKKAPPVEKAERKEG